MKRVLKYLSITIISALLAFSNINYLKAASASISISTSLSNNQIVVGKTFTVTIKISSSTALGSWEFTPSYDTSKFKLVSGKTPVAAWADNGNVKSKSYSYEFKAIGTGSGTITVKSYGAYDWDEKKLSISKGSKTVKVITQKELEASYSKNNNLKSLSVDGLKLDPAFNKDTTSYKVEADSNTTSVNIKASVEDSKSKVSGTGKKSVYEGENKFNITVTAQNGSTKTYTIIVNVIDPNPIEVNINNQKYTVVKRESILEDVEDFERTTTTINDQKIPVFYNKTNDFTLVGLKNSEGELEYFLYDKNTNSYSYYNEVKLNEFKIYPLKIDKKFSEDYKPSKTTIGTVEFDSLKLDNSDYSIIHAKDLSTGKDDYYTYDSKTNTMIRYTDEDTESYKNELEEYKKLILFLGAESVLIIFILICILISKLGKNKKRKKKLKELENQNKKEEKIKKEEKETKNVKKEEKSDKIEKEINIKDNVKVEKSISEELKKEEKVETKKEEQEEIKESKKDKKKDKKEKKKKDKEIK